MKKILIGVGVLGAMLGEVLKEQGGADLYPRRTLDPDAL